MLFLARTESPELQILKILNTRMDLTADDQGYYFNLKKGFDGEVQFDLFTEQLQSDCLILNDLLLEINNSKFQIDSLIIFQDTIYLFEVKNFEGDFCYESDSFNTFSGKEIKDPIIQLKRSKSLLRQLIKKLGYNLSIEAFVVFINPEFTLYQAPKNLPIIFPTQIITFLKKLNMIPSKLKPWHMKLAEKLVSLNINHVSFGCLPPYKYDQLKKGFTCTTCSSFSIFVRGKKIVCNECGCEEFISSAVMRMVEEFKLLFPNRKITTNEIHDWCEGVVTKKRISRVLRENFNIVGVRNWSYYE